MTVGIDHCFHRLSTTMDIFHSRFYRLNVSLLGMLGLWPYQKNKSWQMIQQIMCPISVFTVMLSQAIKLIEIWGDLDIMIECLTPMGVQLGAFVKFINSLVNRKKLTELLEIIKSDWSDLRNEKEVEILTKYGQEGRNLTILYAAFLYTSLVIYLMVPLLPRILDVIVPLNESRPAVYLYQTQYYVDPEEYFIWIFLHTYSGTIVTITCVVAADAMFACYVMHVCGILAIIGYGLARHRLENLMPKGSDADASMASKDDDLRCHQEIILCIDQHYRIRKVATMIESCYTISYLLILGISMILLSFSAVQILIKFGEVEEMIRLLQFNLAQLNHLFFNSWPGEKLINESINFRESLYAAKWYLLSERNKNLLRFVMLRALLPMKITAGKLYVMSMENFGVVVQTSVSYFTVFASLR